MEAWRRNAKVQGVGLETMWPAEAFLAAARKQVRAWAMMPHVAVLLLHAKSLAKVRVTTQRVAVTPPTAYPPMIIGITLRKAEGLR